MITKINGETIEIVAMNLNQSSTVYSPDTGKEVMCSVCGKSLEYGDTIEKVVDENGVPGEKIWCSCPEYMQGNDEHDSVVMLKNS